MSWFLVSFPCEKAYAWFEVSFPGGGGGGDVHAAVCGMFPTETFADIN